ncbi:hypothetical protein LCGC14_0456740 [marine sediment metagenome]|uniref:Uncharacterized protein n=1 Tax=marine sediment metagenome TaxID=412755 RepID=A0A0F9SZ71_9ZZZZ
MLSFVQASFGERALRLLKNKAGRDGALSV